MSLSLTLLILAAAPPCEGLWPAVWKAYSAQELSKGTPPLFQKFPDAKARLEKAWLVECRAFEQATLDCARGVTLEAELGELRRKLQQQKVPKQVIDELVDKVRADWSPLACRDVERSLDAAGAAAARAGVPKSDDCMGADLESGKCQCAHSRCMDICCPKDWVCAHSGAATSKCIRPR
jgi:hypothetical protein